MKTSGDEWMNDAPRRGLRESAQKNAKYIELSEDDNSSFDVNDDADSEYDFTDKKSKSPKKLPNKTLPTPLKTATKPAIPKAKTPSKSKAATILVDDDDIQIEGENEEVLVDNEVSKESTKTKVKAGPKVKATTVPVKLPAKLGEALIMQCERDPDLEGDIGAVGRIYVQPEEDATIRLDLKGYTFEGNIAPCPSFWLVRIKDNEAKIDAIAENYIDMQCIGSVLGKETILEGYVEDADYMGDTLYMDEDDEGAHDQTAAEQKKSAKSSKKIKILASSDVAPVVKKSAATKKKVVKRKPATKKTAKAAANK